MENNKPELKKCPHCKKPPTITRSGQMCKCWNHDEYMMFEDWNRRPIEDTLLEANHKLMTALHPVYHKILAMHSGSELASFGSGFFLGIHITIDEARTILAAVDKELARRAEAEQAKPELIESDRFRVWSVNENEWKSTNYVFLEAGNLIDVRGRIELSRETYIVEFWSEFKDKNRNSIYAGDLLCTISNNVVPVVQRNGCFYWGDSDTMLNHKDCEFVEIIGTIHDASNTEKDSRNE